jgi:nucleoside-diphosphate-sugar epimerase
MNILVIGASGRVGSQLVENLLRAGHQVVGTTRQEEKLFDSPNFTQINLDLLGEPDAIENAIPDDIEAIYFVSGSRGKNLLQVDLHGAVKTMQAAAKKNIERYILLSSLFALDTDRWNDRIREDLGDYYIAKHYADAWLVNNTDLNYTILQPGTLKEKDGSGNIEVNVEEFGENAIEDVAGTLLEVLDNPAAYRQVITMHQGDKPIKAAISEL